jgi:hypothetical protein
MVKYRLIINGEHCYEILFRGYILYKLHRLFINLKKGQKDVCGEMEVTKKSTFVAYLNTSKYIFFYQM